MTESNSSPELHSIIEGTVESIAFGGEGVMRHGNFVVFIPFTAPGDRITCRIVEKKSSYAKGSLQTILQASKERIEPLCPYFGKCGGCQLQHLNPSAQNNYKVDAVVGALTRIAKMEIPAYSFIPANLNWAYRRHITLHLKITAVGFMAGYIGIDGSALVAIKQCPIFEDIQNSPLPLIQDFLSKIPHEGCSEGKLILLKNNLGLFILNFIFDSHLSFQPFKLFFEENPTIAGLIIQTPQERHVMGDINCELDVEGLKFHYTPETFIQNHPEQSQNIYKKIDELFKGDSKTILDLYCGFGVSSLLLAKRGHRVIGIELNPKAIQLANHNAQLNHLKTCSFYAGDVERILPRKFAHLKPQAVLLNPPRVGLSNGVIDHIVDYAAEELVYVSCMPATLARDLKRFAQAGYKIKELFIYDMFPQTAHVETLVYIRRS